MGQPIENQELHCEKRCWHAPAISKLNAENTEGKISNYTYESLATYAPS